MEVLAIHESRQQAIKYCSQLWSSKLKAQRGSSANRRHRLRQKLTCAAGAKASDPGSLWPLRALRVLLAAGWRQLA